MAVVSAFIDRPQRTLLRRALFQVHLWSGLALTIYVVAVAISGSVLVFERELQAWAFPEFHTRARLEKPLADPAVVLRNVEAAYEGYRVSSVNWPAPHRHSFVAYPSRSGDTRTVYADPYSGEILGELPRTGWLRWTWDLHVYLLAGAAGVRANGILAACLLVSCVSVLVVWWPGLARWKRAFLIDLERGWRRIVFDLHSAVGIWTAAFLIIWCVSGVYLTFSQEFRALISAFSPLTVRTSLPRSQPQAAAHPPQPSVLVQRALDAVPGSVPARYTRPSRPDDPAVVLVARDAPGDRMTVDEVSVYFDRYTGRLLDVRPERGSTSGDFLMVWLFPLHAGWFGSVTLQVLWAVMGLTPAVLAVSGAIMWWNRVVARALP